MSGIPGSLETTPAPAGFAVTLTIICLLWGLCGEPEGETPKLCKSAFGFHFHNISDCVSVFKLKIQEAFAPRMFGPL